MASGCPLSWTNLQDQKRVKVVASNTEQKWQSHCQQGTYLEWSPSLP